MMEMWILEGTYFSYINGDTSDTSKKLYEYFGHTSWLDDSYTHWVWTWNSHLCHCSNIILRFNADVHQLMLGGKISHISNFQCNVMISTS